MNKYLLLRDNKQSGPYTVAELIDKGIKPYDLVWLDGKSAAWRYPSEIDELKAYAPAVEEQPYDRFYKKPEAEDEKKSPFQPTLVNEATPKKIDTPPKKVYINFPGQKKAVPVIQPIHSSLQEEARAKNEMVNKSGSASWSAENTVADAHAGRRDNAVSTQTPDRRLFYAVVAACFVLIVIISILMINYGNQRSSIKQLNEMVQQMEKRQKEQNQSAKAALASRVVSAPAVDRTIDLPNTEVGQNQSAVPASPEIGHHAMNALQKPEGTSAAVAAASTTPRHKPATVTAQLNSESSLQNTFAPAKASADPATTASASNIKTDSKENLFNLVSVKPNNFKTGLFGGVVNLQLTLTNNSTHELQQVAIEVKYFSPEKKLVKTQTVFFKNVAPNSHSIIDVPKTNRGVTIDYAVTDIRN